jgi:hypothetical protein
MKTGRVSAGRGLLAFALVAALGLTVVAGPASAGASRDARAVVAKKKCKKAKKGAVSAKKKKCKKNHVLAIPGPLVRGTITWPSGQVDLHAFDASGNRSGIVFPCSLSVCPMTEGIPNGAHSPDVAGGTESFTDNIFVQGGAANREFAYAVCFYASATVSFTGVNALGQSQTLPVTGNDGEQHTLTLPTGPQVPASFSCGDA